MHALRTFVTKTAQRTLALVGALRANSAISRAPAEAMRRLWISTTISVATVASLAVFWQLSRSEPEHDEAVPLSASPPILEQHQKLSQFELDSTDLRPKSIDASWMLRAHASRPSGENSVAPAPP